MVCGELLAKMLRSWNARFFVLPVALSAMLFPGCSAATAMGALGMKRKMCELVLTRDGIIFAELLVSLFTYWFIREFVRHPSHGGVIRGFCRLLTGF